MLNGLPWEWQGKTCRRLTLTDTRYEALVHEPFSVQLIQVSSGLVSVTSSNTVSMQDISQNEEKCEDRCES
jgi:hypothetical protein